MTNEAIMDRIGRWKCDRYEYRVSGMTSRYALTQLGVALTRIVAKAIPRGVSDDILPPILCVETTLHMSHHFCIQGSHGWSVKTLDHE